MAGHAEFGFLAVRRIFALSDFLTLIFTAPAIYPPSPRHSPLVRQKVRNVSRGGSRGGNRGTGTGGQTGRFLLFSHSWLEGVDGLSVNVPSDGITKSASQRAE